MSGPISNSRTLRSNTIGSLKPPSAAAPQPVAGAGPSNITLFLTNLRLLDLDLRDDWPGITAVALSAKDARKRIQYVEWALYQLFVLWDPEDTRYKLEAFFPPLEPLQSLNLRAALFRCLEQAKKAGVLGRDTILRKTMLDECKGERIEEVLAVFSNVVLKKVLQESESEGHKAVAEVLALENFSYSGERTVLSSLIWAHKASLSKGLREKDTMRARYLDFTDLLNLNERRIARRGEYLKEVIDERDDHDTISSREVASLQGKVQKNWSGADEWLQAVIHGDSRVSTDGVLGTPFDKVWDSVESGSIGELEGKKHVGLLEQLDARVKDQEARLDRWKDFGKSLSKYASGTSPTKTAPVSTAPKKIDLGFTRHQALQIGRGDAKKSTDTMASSSLDEYTRLVENMQIELAGVGKPRPQTTRSSRQSVVSLAQESPEMSPRMTRDEPSDRDEAWSSESDGEEPLPTIERVKAPASQAPPTAERLSAPPPRSFHDSPSRQQRPNISISIDSVSHLDATDPSVKAKVKRIERRSQIRPQTPPPLSPPTAKVPILAETGPDLADQILDSVEAISPSPKKQRHTLSLAERTRLSMSRVSHSKYSDMHDEFEGLADLPVKPNRAGQSQPTKDSSIEPEIEIERHADLIERTRKSMAGFEAAQQKAQIARRRSVKDAKKKQRESTYFPRVEEEPMTPRRDVAMEDPDYADAFKSRPKIATSPAVSPTKISEGEEDENEAW